MRAAYFLLMLQTEYQACVANWEQDSEAIKDIRTRVFIEEQHVPAELEWDGLDDCCTHFVILHRSQAIATARLKPDGQIGRMVVLKHHRNRGVGSLLLSTVLSFAENNHIDNIYLHAQVQVIDFYQKHGFTPYGEEFLDAGIPHREMFRKCAK